MYLAYHIPYSIVPCYPPPIAMSLIPVAIDLLAGYATLINFLILYIPILGCGGSFRHSVPSFLDQNSHLGSICVEMT